jgi:hypothetical protein
LVIRVSSGQARHGMKRASRAALRWNAALGESQRAVFSYTYTYVGSPELAASSLYTTCKATTRTSHCCSFLRTSSYLPAPSTTRGTAPTNPASPGRPDSKTGPSTTISRTMQPEPSDATATSNSALPASHQTETVPASRALT